MHDEAVALLMEARATKPGALLPPALRPKTEAAAYAIQRRCMAQLGPIGGWKVGAAGPDAMPNCAPMPAGGLHKSPAVLDGTAFTTRDIESEIAFILAWDLPPRGVPYDRDEVLEAIGSCYPGIEVLQSRFEDEANVDPLSNLADLIRHGAYVLGDPMPNWRSINFATVEVVQTIGDAELRRRGNPAGDMIRLIEWLANEGSDWAGGLRAGQIITCGSWTGKTPAPDLSTVTVAFSCAAPVEVRFD